MLGNLDKISKEEMGAMFGYYGGHEQWPSIHIVRTGRHFSIGVVVVEAFEVAWIPFQSIRIQKVIGKGNYKTVRAQIVNRGVTVATMDLPDVWTLEN